MELDRRVIEARLMKLEHCIHKLGRYRSLSSDHYLSDEDTQDIVERNFQLAVQVCMDIANYLIARLSLQVPEEEGNIFAILGKAGAIPEALGDEMRGMVGFRNILVHGYLKIDPSEVHRILTTRLGDLEHFAQSIADFLERVDRGDER